MAEQDLRLAAPDLEVRWDARTELDELVVEKRNAYLERMGHRRTVEVMQHQVGERQLGIEEERQRQRLARRDAVEPVADCASRGSSVDVGKRASKEPSASGVIEVAAHGEESLDRIPRHRGLARPAHPVGPDPSEARGSGDCRSRQPTDDSQRPGDAMLPIAAEELVGSLPRQCNGHVLRRDST